MDYNEFDFTLENLKTNLYKILELCKLPLGAIYYVIKDLFNELNNQYIASVNSYSFNNPTKETVNNVTLLKLEELESN